MVTVAHHEPPAVLVPLVGQLGYVCVYFGFQRGGQHPSCARQDDLVDQGGAVDGGAVVVHYAQHGRPFPAGAANTDLAR